MDKIKEVLRKVEHELTFLNGLSAFDILPEEAFQLDFTELLDEIEEVLDDKELK